MLEAKQSTGWSRGQIVLAAVLLAGAILLAFGVRASAADAACTGQFCGYSGENYNGGELGWPCISTIGGQEGFPVEEKSAKNGCGGSYEIGWVESGGVINVKACLFPGEQRSAPGRWDILIRVASC